MHFIYILVPEELLEYLWGAARWRRFECAFHLLDFQHGRIDQAAVVFRASYKNEQMYLIEFITWLLFIS